MARWFRLYDELLDDPKVQQLPPDLFKSWINLLCLASRRGGTLPATAAETAFALRCNENDAVTLLERLSNAGLIDRRNGGVNGVTIAPHGWDKRQYSSDTSTDRVKRFRERQRAATETPPDTETETDTEAEEESNRRTPAPAKTTPQGELEAVLDSDHAKHVVEHRKKLGKPLTVRAAQLLAGKFAQAPDPNVAADAMVANGWQGFEVGWLENRGAPKGRGPPPSAENGFVTLFHRLREQ